MTLRIRNFHDDDKPLALAFIDATQIYEHRFEPDRRVDATVASEHFEYLQREVAHKSGRIYVAELDGSPVGWAVFTVQQSLSFVIEQERTFGYINELFVGEAVRGKGVGQALICACEAEAQSRGLTVIMIGVLARNTRTARIYGEAGYEPYLIEGRKYLKPHVKADNA